jgi:hypothetical protein
MMRTKVLPVLLLVLALLLWFWAMTHLPPRKSFSESIPLSDGWPGYSGKTLAG